MVSNKQYPVGQYPDGFFCPKSNPNRTFIPIFSYSYRVFNIVHANLLEPQSSQLPCALITMIVNCLLPVKNMIQKRPSDLSLSHCINQGMLAANQMVLSRHMHAALYIVHIHLCSTYMQAPACLHIPVHEHVRLISVSRFLGQTDTSAGAIVIVEVSREL